MLRLSKNQPHYLQYEQLTKWIEEEVPAQEKTEFTMAALDFDHFSYVNDMFGYEVGDRILYAFARHLTNCLKEGEYFCHLHADQYLLWMRKEKISQRLIQMVETNGWSEHIFPEHYHLVCCCGIIEAQGHSFSGLFDRANFARKKSKGHYQSTFLSFDDSMEEELQWHKAMNRMLDTPLKDKEFEMFLQPKIMLHTGELAGAEALVRWNSSEYGRLFPDRFISIMEQNGFIRRLDFFMLEEACKYLQNTIERGETILPISVNFSRVHIHDADFVDQVLERTARYHLDPGLIEIEITENIFLNDYEALVKVCTDFKQKGFCVTLDDFGSAYSSLNCLRILPVDVIKVDKSFLDESSDAKKGRTILIKVVEMIKELGIVSVIEGIETEEQAEFLRKLGCDMGQGYFYGRPMPIDKYSKYQQEKLRSFH